MTIHDLFHPNDFGLLMARPRKKGLDYFPLDVNLDYKWDAVEAMHGLEGFAVCIKLFQECYQEENGEVCFSGVIRRRTFAKKTNITEETLNGIIATAVEVELFDKSRWEENTIITSSGIKKRIDAVNSERESARKRFQKNGDSSSKKSSSPEKLPKNCRRFPEESPNNASSSGVFLSRETKLNKTKLKESKENNTTAPAPARGDIIDMGEGKFVSVCFFKKLVEKVGSPHEAGRILYRAKDSNAPEAWIRAGFKQGYVGDAHPDEDDNPAAVNAWIQKTIYGDNPHRQEVTYYTGSPQHIGEDRHV